MQNPVYYGAFLVISWINARSAVTNYSKCIRSNSVSWRGVRQIQTVNLQTRTWVSQTRTSVSQTSILVSQTSTLVSQNSTSVRSFRLAISDGNGNMIYNLPVCKSAVCIYVAYRSWHVCHTAWNTEVGLPSFVIQRSLTLEVKTLWTFKLHCFQSKKIVFLSVCIL